VATRPEEVGDMGIISKCDIYATPLLASKIAAAIDTHTPSDERDWGIFEVQHALLVRIYELECEAGVLRSRLRAGRVSRKP
jgi:hypothetical protein